MAIESTDVRHSIPNGLGSGANSFLLDYANVGGGVACVGSEAVDGVEITDVVPAVNASLPLGNGTANIVDIERVSTGMLAITSGTGVDDMFMERVTERHGVTIWTGGGDTFGSDMLNIGFNATIDAGSGNDAIRIEDTVVGYFFYAFLGSNDDMVNV